MKTLYELLSSYKFPVSYMKFNVNEGEELTYPYLVYMGDGQDRFISDNLNYFTENNYRVEYYFKFKNENEERDFENFLKENHIIWEKSEDTYIDEEDLYLINYYL